MIYRLKCMYDNIVSRCKKWIRQHNIRKVVMSKGFIMYCRVHGRISINVQNPPVLIEKIYCPFCGNRVLEKENANGDRVQLKLENSGA